MPYMIRGDWVSCAFAAQPVVTPSETVAFKVHHLPDLLLPSGRLAASDPFITPQPEPFHFAVAPGSYAVDLAIADYGDDQRVAFARIAFGPWPPKRWAMATVGDQDPSTLPPTDIFGYPVDAGTGCFMAPEAGVLLDRRMQEEPQYFESMIEQMQKTYRHTWSWAEIRPDPSSPIALLAFSSGLGDGMYASYLGFDGEEHISCLVTDFGVIYDAEAEEAAVKSSQATVVPAASPPPRRWWQFWRPPQP